MVVEISAESAKAVYHLIPSSEVATSYVGQDAALAAKVTSKTLLVSPASSRRPEPGLSLSSSPSDDQCRPLVIGGRGARL